MNGQEAATLTWHNGNIIPKEAAFSKFDFNFLFNSNIIVYFFTSGTDILFFDATYSHIQPFLNDFNFDSTLITDNQGETLKNETKRLLIRNKYYKTARCYILQSRSFQPSHIDEFIFIVPDLHLFSLDKIIKKTIVSNRFFKPLGVVMNFPTMANEYKKIVRAEIEREKADDCIILNQDQYIVESYLGNIFLIEHGMVMTPSLNSGCTPLLMRDIILRIFKQLNFQVIEKNDIQLENLLDANEVIVAGETGIYSLKGIEYKRFFDNIRKVLISKIIEACLD
jgi:branched-subunit amino acid aminotransferase/4-amino-4-deoxychorismate lyase